MPTVELLHPSEAQRLVPKPEGVQERPTIQWEFESLPVLSHHDMNHRSSSIVLDNG